MFLPGVHTWNDKECGMYIPGLNVFMVFMNTSLAYDVFMLLLCLTTEIPAVTDVLKGISCG
jgi:hypothetical protein